MKVTKDLIKFVDKVLKELNLEHLSAQVYQMLDELNARGVDRASAVATAIYKACKDACEPITISTICIATRANQKSVFRLLKKQGWLGNVIPPEQYIDKILSKERISKKLNEEQKQRLKALAIEFLKRMDKIGATPLTKAATAVYLAVVKLGVDITQADLWVVTGVSDVSIRNVIAKMFGRRSDKYITAILRND